MLFHFIRRVFTTAFFQANLWSLFVAIAFYASSSYFLLGLAGESKLIAFENYFYWLVVTASTVGYGDLGPSSTAGKIITSLWVIPMGLSLFAVVLTRFGLYLSEFYLRGKRGLRMTQITNHCVILGWNGPRTLRLIDLLLAKTNAHNERILLCANADIENPLPGKIDFVCVEHFANEQGMRRANLSQAKRIIIDVDQDDITLTSALYCAKVSPNSHKTAYLQDDNIAQLLKLHCPKVEVIPSVSVEMLARSTLDPGSARVHQQLLDATEGMTQYSIVYEGEQPLPFDALFHSFKNQNASTIIAIRPQGESQINLNPSLDVTLSPGDTLYYISASRLSHKACFSAVTAKG
jgi:voltage-gated potassium channel